MVENTPRREKPSIDPLGETVSDLPSPIGDDPPPISPAPLPRPSRVSKPSAPPAQSQPRPQPKPASPGSSRAPRHPEPEDIELVGTPTQRSRDAANTDIDLASVFDRTSGTTPSANLNRDDPEAEILRRAAQAAGHSAAVRSAPKLNPKAALLSPFGQLITSLALALIGLALAIMASIEQTLPLLIAAAIVVPVTAWLTWRRYQQWLGHRRYMYRLLETLGEDVADFDPSKSIRSVKLKVRK